MIIIDGNQAKDVLYFRVARADGLGLWSGELKAADSLRREFLVRLVRNVTRRQEIVLG